MNESITFSIHDNEGEEVYTVTSNKTNGDSEIINDSKMDKIRNHQFFVSIDDDDPIMIQEQELKIGANYQLVYVNKSTTNVNTFKFICNHVNLCCYLYKSLFLYITT